MLSKVEPTRRLHHHHQHSRRAMGHCQVASRSPQRSSRSDVGGVTPTQSTPRPAGTVSRNPEPPVVSERIDLSRRGLSKLPMIVHPASVCLLNLEHNLIRSIDGLQGLSKLVVLSLYDNQLESLKALESLTVLKLLLIGKNRLTDVDNVNALLNLQVLDVHSNQITNVTGISDHPKLRVINLAGNRLTNCVGLHGMTQLIELNLRRNRLKSLNGLDNLPSLQRLYISHNALKSPEDIDVLKIFSNLREITINDNPINQRTELPAWLCQNLPHLEMLDSVAITEEKRNSILNALRQNPPPEGRQVAGSPRISGKEKAIHNAQKRWELLRSEAIKITKQRKSEKAVVEASNNSGSPSNSIHRIPSPSSAFPRKSFNRSLSPRGRPLTALQGTPRSSHSATPVNRKSLTNNFSPNIGNKSASKNRISTSPYKIDLTLNPFTQPQGHLTPPNNLPNMFLTPNHARRKQTPGTFRYNNLCGDQSSVFSMLRLLSNAATTVQQSDTLKSSGGPSSANLTEDTSSSESDSESSESRTPSPVPKSPSPVQPLTVPDLPRSPTCKQGPDFVIEIENDTLSIFGPDALRLINCKWSPEVCSKVTHVLFRFVQFDDLVPLFEGCLRQKFSNLVDFTFQDTCLDRLFQLNGLASFSSVLRLSVLSDGNQVVHHPQWRLYAIFRLGHRGLKVINNEDVKEVEREEATKLFSPLARLTFSCQSKERILQLYCLMTSSSTADPGIRTLLEDNQDPSLLQEAIGREAMIYPTTNSFRSGEGMTLQKSRATTYIHNLVLKYMSFARKLRHMDDLQIHLLHDMVKSTIYQKNHFKTDAKELLKSLSEMS